MFSFAKSFKRSSVAPDQTLDSPENSVEVLKSEEFDPYKERQVKNPTT